MKSADFTRLGTPFPLPEDAHSVPTHAPKSPRERERERSIEREEKEGEGVIDEAEEQKKSDEQQRQWLEKEIHILHKGKMRLVRIPLRHYGLLIPKIWH